MKAQQLMIAIMTGSLALSSPAVLAATAAATASSNLQQAIQHTVAAIQAGQQKDAPSLVQHADSAINSAMMAEKVNKNRKIKEGVRELRDAMRTAQGPHAEQRMKSAVSRAQTALSDFRSAQH